MMIRFLLLSLAILNIYTLKAQQCGIIAITTQDQIDNFAINNPNCTEAFALQIQGTSITNLNGLSQLESVNGDGVTITNTSITNFSGLDNIATITGRFYIMNNNDLENFEGFGSLQFIDGDVEIKENNSLENFQGLTSLNTITADISSSNEFEIEINNSLTSLEGLNNLTNIQTSFSVAFNNNLLSLQGLDNLESIAGRLRIGNNMNLNSFSGLENLRTVGGDLVVALNDALVSFDGIANLESINGRLNIEQNPMLTSINALDNLDPNSIQNSLFIFANFNLSSCAIEPICENLDNSSLSVTIELNNAGCASIDEVEDECQLLDLNQNNSTRFSIYPNPASEQVFISTSEGIIIEHIIGYDVLGAQVFKTSSQTVEVSHLANGVYFVRIETNQGSSIKKLIKE